MGGYGMTDKSIEREIEFTDWWYFQNKKAPNYADSIEWADKTMIDKACEWLKISVEDYQTYDAWKGDYIDVDALINDFKKEMEGKHE